MKTPDRYEAFWVPGLDSDFDADRALEIALDWLASVQVPGPKVIAMYAKAMKDNRPLLTWASQTYAFISPRSRDNIGRGPRAVLAIWPDGQTLELAQQLAFDGVLCVIPGSLYDVKPWIVRCGAVNLAEPGDDSVSLATLSPEVSEALDHTLFFGGHNGFLGGGEKENAIRALRSIIQAGHRPNPDDVEGYAAASGETRLQGGSPPQGVVRRAPRGEEFSRLRRAHNLDSGAIGLGRSVQILSRNLRRK
ncbi:MAG: hypothetical protein ACRDGN_09580 [bacterium]